MGQATSLALVDNLRQFVEARPDDPRIQSILVRLKRDLDPIWASAHEEDRMLRLLSCFLWADFGIVSAWREGIAKDSNLQSQLELARALREIGLGFLPVEGQWPGVPSRALFVPLLKRETAVDLARRFDQTACVWGKEGRAQVIDVGTGGKARPLPRLRPAGVDVLFDHFCAVTSCGGKGQEAQDRWVEEQFAGLKSGDTIYAYPSDHVDLRSLVWPSSCLFRYLGRKGDEHELLPLIRNRVQDGRATVENVGALLQLGSGARSFPTRRFDHVFHLAGYLEV